MRYIAMGVALALLAGCASTSAVPVAKDAVLISTSAAPSCGRLGAQKVALAEAAVETIRRGYERFIIVGAHASSDVRVVGHTPVFASTSFSANTFGGTTFGTGTTTFSGGQPIVGGSHDQEFLIRMFNSGDVGFDRAIDARETLGADWQKRVEKQAQTCF